mmetsp:Transcript_9447/g.23269  ORF Transcript_9447/g.23269 Transcript_9447/m.23269 type:complete len:336 (-) Transcript_9447:390-1397(-)
MKRENLHPKMVPTKKRKKNNFKIPGRKLKKGSATPRPFADIRNEHEVEADWTVQKFVPQSPANHMPIVPLDSPVNPVTKEKIHIPDVSCSPLSPLPPGGFVDGDGLQSTPPPYITLSETPVVPPLSGGTFDVKLQPYDPKVVSSSSGTGSYGSLASFNHSRKQMRAASVSQVVGYAVAPTRKNSKQTKDAIQEQLKKLSQKLSNPLAGLEFAVTEDKDGTKEMGSGKVGKPQKEPGSGQEKKVVGEKPSGSVQRESKSISNVPGKNREKLHTGKEEGKKIEGKKEDAIAKTKPTPTPTPAPPVTTASISTSAAFDASQLAMLQSYMQQCGGKVPF